MSNPLGLPLWIAITDVSIIHSLNTLPAAAVTAGAAAAYACRDHYKRATYARVQPNGYTFAFLRGKRHALRPASAEALASAWRRGGSRPWRYIAEVLYRRRAAGA
jgi:hypothetical protein